MSARHLLSCPCGELIPVTPSQAGGSVTCAQCGQSQSVPRLRDLRELPAEADSERKAPTGWGFRQGVLTAGLLLAAALAATGGWFAANEPSPLPDFNADSRNEVIASDLDRMAPVELWALYQFRYAPMTANGMQVAKDPREAAVERAINQSRWFRDLGLYSAAVVLALAVGAFALLRS